MSTIDIRESSDAAVDNIVFADHEYATVSRVENDSFRSYIRLCDEYSELATVRYSNINTLIDALYKARELWVDNAN